MNAAAITSATVVDTTEPLRRRLGVLDEDELCTLLGVERRTVQEWRSKGRGPASIRAGNAILFRETDVREWLASQVRQTPESQYSIR